MHYGNWNDNLNWLGMGLMMVLVWSALIAIVVLLTRRANHQPSAGPTTPSPTPASTTTAQQILAERLARGEIDIEDYRTRKQALEATT